LWDTTAAPTTPFKKFYNAAAIKTYDGLVFLKTIDDEIKQIELIFEKSFTPYTPGTFSDWRRN
jgi:hypothetical protein